MSCVWRVNISRTNDVVRLFNPPDRMYQSSDNRGSVFSVSGGSYMLDAPTAQIGSNYASEVRIAFDRPMHIKEMYTHIDSSSANYSLSLYDENWVNQGTNVLVANPSSYTTHTFPHPFWAKNVGVYSNYTNVSRKFAFGVLNYVPSTLLINSTHELNFDELEYEALVPTASKDLVMQMVSGCSPDTTVTASLVSS